MIGRSQLPWWLGGEGVKTTEKKTVALYLLFCGFDSSMGGKMGGGMSFMYEQSRIFLTKAITPHCTEHENRTSV